MSHPYPTGLYANKQSNSLQTICRFSSSSFVSVVYNNFSLFLNSFEDKISYKLQLRKAG